MKDLKNLYLLEIVVAYSFREYLLSKSKYTATILRQTCLSYTRETNILLELNVKYTLFNSVYLLYLTFILYFGDTVVYVRIIILDIVYVLHIVNLIFVYYTLYSIIIFILLIFIILIETLVSFLHFLFPFYVILLIYCFILDFILEGSEFVKNR